jgi:polyisoprenoid-binding protein YceI
MSRLSGWMVCVALSMISAMATQAAEYKLSGDNTKIQFEGTKKEGKHTGSFPKLSGTLNLGEDATKAKIAVTIEMDALDSDDPKLTGHLKSPDFFETKKYPEAKFVSKAIKADKDGFIVTGDLTMRGKTKEISFPAKIAAKTGGATLSSEFTINRSDWGITYGEGKIDEAVKLTVDVKTK